MACWPFDAVPVSLAALVVICVAGEKRDIRMAYSQHSMAMVHTSWIWPCRIKGEGPVLGRVRKLGCGVAVQIGSAALQLIGNYRTN